MTAGSILYSLLDGTMQLWIATERKPPVIVVTAVTDYPEAKVLSVVLLAGRDIRAWLHHVEAALEAFARDQGCTALEAWVRPGLIGAQYRPRRAVLSGWKPLSTLVRRPV